MRINAKFLQQFWQQEKYYNGLIISVALLTSVLLWFNDYQMFDTHSLQILWRIKHHPQSVFQYLLYPFARYDWLVAVFLTILTTFSLWLFCRISLLIGIGKQTAFLLFLLLNFNPEFNDVRFQISIFQLLLPLWLIGIYLYFFYCHRSLYIACVLWLISAWIIVFLEPITIMWAILFPCGILFWPGRKGKYWHLYRRTGLLLSYYAVLLIISLFIPTWRENLLSFYTMISQRELINYTIPFINPDNHFDFSFFDKFMLSAALIAIDAVKFMGLIILLFAVFAGTKIIRSVLEWQTKYFFLYCFFLMWLIAVALFMYYGYLPEDLVYTPVTMLVLWLSSGAVFYLLQRFKSGRIPPERILILLWLMIAYALASIIFFGPSPDYFKHSGLWARQIPHHKIYSNHYSALYYANESPLPEDNGYADIKHPEKITAKDLLLHVQDRKKALPDNIKLFDVIKTFHNNRGDTVYILRRKQQ